MSHWITASYLPNHNVWLTESRCVSHRIAWWDLPNQPEWLTKSPILTYPLMVWVSPNWGVWFTKSRWTWHEAPLTECENYRVMGLGSVNWSLGPDTDDLGPEQMLCHLIALQYCQWWWHLGSCWSWTHLVGWALRWSQKLVVYGQPFIHVWSSRGELAALRHPLAGLGCRIASIISESPVNALRPTWTWLHCASRHDS